MTRDEALANEWVLDLIRKRCVSDAERDVFDAAKEALRSGTCCDDCISREAAIDVIGGLDIDAIKLANMQKEIYKLPSVKPARVPGKWVNEKWFRNELIGVTCSHCHTIESTFSSFCPNCGADMRGAEPCR